ncbi:MAG: YkgJ family cysteine cluster protein [Pseudomonadota bacterium]
MNNNASEPFDCKMCGQCCHGEGGIVVSPTDLPRIADFLSLAPEVFIEKYCNHVGEKIKIRTGDNGDCVFFVRDKGCSVHEGKPDICRAWPYFRGNIVDKESFTMAKDYCPGIAKDVSHADFAAAGRAYLKETGLSAKDRSREANALFIED